MDDHEVKTDEKPKRDPASWARRVDTMSVGELLQLGQGAVVELDRAVGEPLDVMVNGALVAKGEIVLVNERFGIRLTSIVESSGSSTAKE